MRILIDEDFFVDIDERNYVLKENIKTKRKDGSVKDSARTEGYFTNLERALDRVIHIKLQRSEEVYDVKEFMREYRILSEYIAERTKNATLEVIERKIRKDTSTP